MTPSTAPIDPADGGDDHLDDHLVDGSDDHLDDRGAAARAAAPLHRITCGGAPTGAQAAAIAAALAELRRVDAAAATEAAELASTSEVPAWTRAGIVEGTGRVTVTRPHELLGVLTIGDRVLGWGPA